MGSPKKQTNKYTTPRHPWQKARLEEEGILVKEFGLKNKKEVWKESSFIKNIKQRVKDLNSVVGRDVTAQKEKLFEILQKYNLLKDGQTIDNALDLTVRDVMERRLQTQVLRQGLAKTILQARQFIVHGHILVAGKKITAPSHMMTRENQFSLTFVEKSALFDPEHPERKAPELKTPVVEEKSEEKSDESPADIVQEIEAAVEEVEE
jgi:small subunit ribosomal protein S4